MPHPLPASRRLALPLIAALPLLFAGCGGGSSGSSLANNVWTWVSGSKTVNALPVDTAGTTATPGARSGAMTWSDASGNLWLFGGVGYPSSTSTSSTELNDVWEYVPSTSTWALITASAAPVARDSAATWTDASGHFWMFGGNGASGLLDDLWEYTPGSPGTWTLVSGSAAQVATQPNYPGSRDHAATWFDGTNFWLMGGLGIDSAHNQGNLNDLWEYSPGSPGTWTLVSGVTTRGAVTTTTPTAQPGARYGAAAWYSQGALWLLGGSTGAGTYFNDLWKFTPSTVTPGTGSWSLVSGVTTSGAAGAYGTQGAAGSGNTPGARALAQSWTDSSGNLWVMGGVGFDAVATSGDLNDVWEFSPTSGLWAWVSGASVANPVGAYPTTSGTASGAQVGGRYGAATWVDSSHRFWLYGGNGLDSNSAQGNLNDLWSYLP
jgi:hypothetical protein